METLSQSARRALRERQVLECNSRLLDLWLEHRALYREAVAEGQHRGLPLPVRPDFGRLAPLRRPAESRPAQASAAALVRTFAAAEVERAAGRTLEARIVPYNTPTTVRDGGGAPYTETWMPGTFAEQVRSGTPKVLLNFEHGKGLSNVVGHAVDLDERSDGLHGRFAVLKTQDGDKALELVREGVLTGLSLEAVALDSTRSSSGIVERRRARLDAAALTRRPAFADARVIAVRKRGAGG